MEVANVCWLLHRLTLQVYVPSAHAESTLLNRRAEEGVFKSCCWGQRSAAASSSAAPEGSVPTRPVEPTEGPHSWGEDVSGCLLRSGEDVYDATCWEVMSESQDGWPLDAMGTMWLGHMLILWPPLHLMAYMCMSASLHGWMTLGCYWNNVVSHMLILAPSYSLWGGIMQYTSSH